MSFGRKSIKVHSQLNTDIMLLASLILHANIAELTAQLMSLSYVYLISSDDGSIIVIFVQINILEGRAGYASMVTFQSLFHIHSIDNRNSKMYK